MLKLSPFHIHSARQPVWFWINRLWNLTSHTVLLAGTFKQNKNNNNLCLEDICRNTKHFHTQCQIWSQQQPGEADFPLTILMWQMSRVSKRLTAYPPPAANHGRAHVRTQAFWLQSQGHALGDTVPIVKRLTIELNLLSNLSKPKSTVPGVFSSGVTEKVFSFVLKFLEELFQTPASRHTLPWEIWVRFYQSFLGGKKGKSRNVSWQKLRCNVL